MSEKSPANEKRDDVLRRMLKTPPKPQKPPADKAGSSEADPMPTDDPDALVEWGKRNIQGE